MNFKETLISGELIKRYKRFFADVKIGKNIITAHCPNTGSMMGLLKKGNIVWISKSNDPKRKLKYTLQIIEDQNSKVGINTHLTNKIVLDALKNKKIKKFENFNKIQREFKFGKNSRFDFVLEEKGKKVLIEVKNVTLSRKKGIAEFPDSITSRGLKHLKELLKAKKKGYEIYMLYVIQREDCNKFELANDIDPDYCKFLEKAIKKKLNILCYDCKFSLKGIKLNQIVKFNFNE
tara:strand:- start:1285 stop:1986 length:702 start_codon:yes stop_codon:yes gene_type:complete